MAAPRREMVASLLTLPPALQAGGEDEAVASLRRCFGLEPGQTAYTGANFERLDGGGHRPEVAHEITYADLVAVAMLSVNVPARAALQILGDRKAEISDLLTAIPTDLQLVEVPVDEINPMWTPWQLWELLRALPGIGWVTAGKLVARKRPLLIPVYDGVVKAVLAPRGRFWASLATSLQSDDGLLQRRVEDLRERSAIGSDISPLRVLDIVAWMAGKR